MICLNCGYDNIPGVDLCESCGSDLAGHDLPESDAGFGGKLLTDRIADLPMAPALVVSAEARVVEAIERMREARQGCVLVERDGRLAGIFTERDVLVRIVRKGLDPAAVALASVMTPEPLTLAPGDPPAYAIHRMVSQKLRHLPVVDGEKLLGFVSSRSVLRYIHEDVIGERGAA